MAPNDVAALAREMSQSDAGVHTVWSDHSDAMLFCFSGMPTGDAPWTPFQFVKPTAHIDADKVYVRDLQIAWYQFGVPPKTSAVDDTAAMLYEYVVERAPRRVITAGVSAGGYAALLFGFLMDVDEVHAFAPRTYLDIDNRLKYNDMHMDKHVHRLYDTPAPQPEYFDLREVFLNGENTRTAFHIYYADGCSNDLTNARHLADLKNVHEHVYEEGGHQVARHLMETGELQRLLETAVAGKTGQDRAAHQE